MNDKKLISNFLLEIAKQSNTEIIEAELKDKEIIDSAKKMGLIIPSPDFAIFKTKWADIDKKNLNNVRLPQKAVNEGIQTLVGKNLNFEHKGAYNVCGFCLSVKTKGKEIECIQVFYKSLYPNEFEELKEKIKTKEAAVSFEIYNIIDGKSVIKELSDGTKEITKIHCAGTGLLLVNPPACPTAKIFKLVAKEERQFSEELCFAALAIENQENKIVIEYDDILTIAKEKDVKRIELARSEQDWISKYLNEVGYKQKVTEQNYSYFKLALISKAIKEFQKINDWQCKEILNLNCYGDRTRPVYTKLSTSRVNKEELLVDGFYCLEKENAKLVVGIRPQMFNFSITVYSDNSSGDLANDFIDGYEKYASDNNFLKGEKITPRGKFLPIPPTQFVDIKLEANKKQAIQVGALEFFNKKDIYVNNKLPFKRGLIFAGEPGTGKTLVGKALINNTKNTFIWVTAKDLVNGWGDIDASSFGRLLDMAEELAPSILFAEDIDDYFSAKGSIDVIKTKMDGLESQGGIVTILCTNYPEKIPASLIDRPSRFDDVIIFSAPDEQLRYEILDAHVKNAKILNREEVLKKIAKESEGLTGAHLKEIALYAMILASDAGKAEVNEDDFIKALNKVRETRKLIQTLKANENKEVDKVEIPEKIVEKVKEEAQKKEETKIEESKEHLCPDCKQPIKEDEELCAECKKKKEAASQEPKTDVKAEETKAQETVAAETKPAETKVEETKEVIAEKKEEKAQEIETIEPKVVVKVTSIYIEERIDTFVDGSPSGTQEVKGFRKKITEYKDGTKDEVSEEVQVTKKYDFAELEEAVKKAKEELETLHKAELEAKTNEVKAELEKKITEKETEIATLKTQIEQKTQEVATLTAKKEETTQPTLEVGNVDKKDINSYKERQKRLNKIAYGHE